MFGCAKELESTATSRYGVCSVVAIVEDPRVAIIQEVFDR